MKINAPATVERPALCALVSLGGSIYEYAPFELVFPASAKSTDDRGIDVPIPTEQDESRERVVLFMPEM